MESNPADNQFRHIDMQTLPAIIGINASWGGAGHRYQYMNVTLDIPLHLLNHVSMPGNHSNDSLKTACLLFAGGFFAMLLAILTCFVIWKLAMRDLILYHQLRNAEAEQEGQKSTEEVVTHESNESFVRAPTREDIEREIAANERSMAENEGRRAETHRRIAANDATIGENERRIAARMMDGVVFEPVLLNGSPVGSHTESDEA
jgi:hypothetical protein